MIRVSARPAASRGTPCGRRGARKGAARAEPGLRLSWQQRKARKPRPRTAPEPAWVTLLRVVLAETPADHRLAGLGFRHCHKFARQTGVRRQVLMRTMTASSRELQAASTA